MAIFMNDDGFQTLPISERFIAYAESYRSAATVLCSQMSSTKSPTAWPDASVVLMLSAHSVELFIKGIVLASDSTALLEGHDFDDLSREYETRFPDPKYAWDIPFKVEYLGISKTELKSKKAQLTVPSIRYRYPVAKGGEEWKGIFGFEAESFLVTLERIDADFKRILAVSA